MSLINICGICLIAVSACLLLACLLRKNETFFNLRTTVRNHLRLFKDCKFQYVVFYLLPLIFSVGLAMVYAADGAFYTQLIVVIGILVSMQFAMLSILCGYDFSPAGDPARRARVKKVVRETVDAIVFDCVLCLALLLYGLMMIALDGSGFASGLGDTVPVMHILAGAAYYIFVLILLNLLLIVKHMSKIIEFHLSGKREQEK